MRGVDGGKRYFHVSIGVTSLCFSNKSMKAIT